MDAMVTNTRETGAMKKQRGKLTDKQQAFVEYYCGEANWNATKAAIMAGYAKSCANVIGPNNIVKSSIKKAIDKRKAAISKKTDINAVYLLNESMELLKTAKEKDNLNAAARYVEIMCKIVGAFTDNKPNPAAQEERAKRNEKESKAIQELVQIWLNSKYNAVKQVESVEVPKEDRLSIVGDSGAISEGTDGE